MDDVRCDRCWRMFHLDQVAQWLIHPILAGQTGYLLCDSCGETLRAFMRFGRVTAARKRENDAILDEIRDDWQRVPSSR